MYRRFDKPLQYSIVPSTRDIICTLNQKDEEIKFVINPELMLSMYVNEFMLKNEAIYVIGTEQFSKFTGYSATFMFAGNCFTFGEIDKICTFIYDNKPIQCISSILLAFDALKYFKYWDNFSKDNYVREFEKAFIAFKPLESSGDNLINNKPIATGKWGCGVYNGDSDLKFLIQYAVSSIHRREMIFTCYKDKPLYEKLCAFTDIMKKNKVNISAVIQLMSSVMSSKLPEGFSLIKFVTDNLK